MEAQPASTPSQPPSHGSVARLLGPRNLLGGHLPQSGPASPSPGVPLTTSVALSLGSRVQPLAPTGLQAAWAPSTMKKFASSRSLNKILAQCDSSSREYEEIQAVERKWHLHLATPRRLLLDRRAKASLFFAAPPPPKRAPSTTLTLRSKSMTAELEELGE